MISRWIEKSCLSIPGLDRLYLGRYVGIKRSEKRLQFALGLSTPPSAVILYATYTCNFACDHCLTSSDPDAEDGLPFETIARLIREMRELGVEWLVITGGEPLVREDLFEIIGLAKEEGLAVHLSTNGSLVERHRDRLVRARIDSILTSVDGLEETNDRFRRHPGAFKQTFRALELFHEMGVPRRMINTMAYPGNLHELEALGDWIMASSATCWRIALALPSGRVKGEDQLYLSDDQIRWVLGFIRDRRARFPVYLSEQAGYLGPWALQVRSAPFMPWDGLSHFAILPTGDVFGSGVVFEDALSEGNIRDHSLKDLWRNRFQRYRQPVLPEACYECRHLHACGGGTLGMRVGDRHCLKRLWEGGGHT